MQLMQNALGLDAPAPACIQCRRDGTRHFSNAVCWSIKCHYTFGGLFLE